MKNNDVLLEQVKIILLGILKVEAMKGANESINLIIHHGKNISDQYLPSDFSYVKNDVDSLISNLEAERF